MHQRTRPPRRSPSTAQAHRTDPDPGDDLLNRQIADALRQGAEARDARDLATSTEDALANERMRATLRALIDGGGA